MNIGESITTCYHKYFVFKGRATRSEFWWFVLFGSFFSLMANTCVTQIYGQPLMQADPYTGQMTPTFAYWVGLVFNFFAVTLPSMSAAVRRLHDTGRSGWWFWICLTGIGAIFFLRWLAKEGDQKINKYDRFSIEVGQTKQVQSASAQGEPNAPPFSYGAAVESGNERFKAVLGKAGVWIGLILLALFIVKVGSPDLLKLPADSGKLKSVFKADPLASPEYMGVKLGNTRERVRALYGTEKSKSSSLYEWGRVTVSFDAVSAGANWVFCEAQCDHINGIGLGSTRTDVIAAFGRPSRSWSDIDALAYEHADVITIFEFSNDRVRKISKGRL